MRKHLVIAIAFCTVIITFNTVSARDKWSPGRKPHRPWTEGELPELIDPGMQGLKTSAAVDTYNIVKFDFEMMDWQGWTQVDNTAQVDTFFHVDDFAGLGGGDFGRLYPLEGTQSMWCGAAPDSCDPYLRGWSAPPGYGDDWNQMLVSDSLSLSLSGILTISFKGIFDSEAEWDQTVIEYDAGEGNWIEIAMYEGVVSGTFTHQLFLGQTATKLRFHFTSDGAHDDRDGLHNTDGACIIDSLVISDESGIIDYEDFEAASVGDHRTDGDGNCIWWSADIGESYGIYSGLASNLYQDKDPCNNNLGTQIVFFIGSTEPSSTYPGLYNTPCEKAPCSDPAGSQDEMVVSPVIDLTKYSTNNDENQDADIPPGDLNDLGGFLLHFTAYVDLSLTNMVYYDWKIRNVDENGCPGEWQSNGYVYFTGGGEYLFHRFDIGRWIAEERIQVALGIYDFICYSMWWPPCIHNPTPWFDNVRIQRYETVGPQWFSRDLDLFQDQFPTEGSGIEAFVRVDAANDLNPSDDPVIRPGDSAVVTCTSPLSGGIMYDPDGWPQVYCYVRAKYIGCASSCPAHVHPKAAYLYGSSLEGTYGRYVSDDGSQWTKIQCEEARVGNWPGTPVPDVYMVDLNDSLFTRGYMIDYYFSSNDSAGKTSYHPEDAPAKADQTYGSQGTIYDGVSYIFEMTCLPLGCSDILYVDDFHGRGTFWGTVEQYFNPAFLAVFPSTDWPERYDVMNPSSLVGNGLARSATSTILTCYYRTIIWDSGNLSSGTIGDGSPESDKTRDCTLLIDWMTLHPDSIAGAGLWVLGDDVAQDLAGLSSGQALALLTTWCGVEPYPDMNWGSYYALAGGFPAGTVTPKVTGTAAGLFYHTGVPDEWYAFGGCPIINRFGCLAPATGAVTAATYPDYGPYADIGAAIQNVKVNASNAPIRTMWFGHSFMYMRDTGMGEPIIRNHVLHDVISWMAGPLPGFTHATVPKAYKLDQNFPNPFNPLTTIRFDVKERGHVDLRIYNVAGQLVKTLVDEVRDASSYTIIWDGTNNRGTKAASGVYFYKMQSKEFSKTRKMVLLR